MIHSHNLSWVTVYKSISGLSKPKMSEQSEITPAPAPAPAPASASSQIDNGSSLIAAENKMKKYVSKHVVMLSGFFISISAMVGGYLSLMSELEDLKRVLPPSRLNRKP